MGEQRQGRAVLIGAAPQGTLNYLKAALKVDDFIICADGGRSRAEELSIQPDWYVGDNDSGGTPEGLPSTLLPSEKDVSDMEMAIDQAFELGYRDILLAGCTGGRGDHHLANLGLLEEIHARGGSALLLDENNEFRFLAPGVYQVENQPRYKYLGLIPLDQTVTDVHLKGVKYPLENFTLKRGSTRSISNEILAGERAEIKIGTGCVLLVRSQPV